MRAPRTSPPLRRLPKPLIERLSRIELMVFDVDGVLTDGRLWFGVNGEALKVFHVLDGAGIKALGAAGIVTAVLSGRDSPITLRRCAELGIKQVAQGIVDKNAAFDAMRHELGKTLDVCGYMGDDDADLPVLKRVGFAATVPNAADGIADHAHWVSRRRGGDGAVREVCDLLLDARRSLSADRTSRPRARAVRDRGTLVLSVLLIGGLAVGSYWLAQQARLSDAVPRKIGHEVDYTASGITLTRMDERGIAQYVVDASKLVHYADDDSGELTQPRLVGAKADRPEMRVRADLGKTTGDGEEVRLYGNVVLRRQPWKGAQELVAKGPYMLAYPDRELLSSDRPVEVTQGGSRVDANAMQYDNGHRTLRLDGGPGGRIRAVIEARAARANPRAAPLSAPATE